MLSFGVPMSKVAGRSSTAPQRRTASDPSLDFLRPESCQRPRAGRVIHPDNQELDSDRKSGRGPDRRVDTTPLAERNLDLTHRVLIAPLNRESSAQTLIIVVDPAIHGYALAHRIGLIPWP
jgi:hypothetical protein